MKNYAYIDNQNLYMATKTSDEPWRIDLKRLRVYLTDRYDCEKVFLFMGAFDKKYAAKYEVFKSFGYHLIYRTHDEVVHSKKKGNVDTDIVFQMMHDFHHNLFDKAILISGDGDYFKTVNYLVSQGKFERLMLPSHKNASSLYRKLTRRYYIYLDDKTFRDKFRL